MTPLEEMKAWVLFDEEDVRRLHELWPLVEPRLDELTRRFYDRALRFPGAARVFRDAAQIERLRVTLRQWASELLLGPHDQAYFHRRERIGKVHVEVGLEARYMFTAMNVIRDQLCEFAHALPEGSAETCRAIGKVCDIDIAIMTGTYVERREARELRSLQELIVSQMPVTVLIVDGEGRVAAATRPSSRLFGEVEMLGLPWGRALPDPLVREGDLVARMERALRTGHEITIPRVDGWIEGRERNFRVSIVPLDHPQARALVHVEELTEAIANEARLVRAESLAHLGALSAAVAHELRNPLAGISGAIQVISRSMPADDKRKPIMEKVEQQVRRLDDLVTDLLDFARPVAPKAVHVDLAEVVRAVADMVMREHPGLRLEVGGAGAATADPNMLQQILLNLVLNAAQATGGVGRVAVTVEPGAVEVNDDGTGIAQENVEKIFQPFFTTRSRGTGLGLAICRKLSGAMNGDLALKRGRLPGACFRVEVPTAT